MTLLSCLVAPSAGGEKDSDAAGQAASDDEEEDEGPIDTKQLAAETQRVLRGMPAPHGSRLMYL